MAGRVATPEHWSSKSEAALAAFGGPGAQSGLASSTAMVRLERKEQILGR